MSDGALERPLVGVLGERTERVESAVRAAGGRTSGGSPSEVVAADPVAVVAVGESALLSLVPTGVSAPVLPAGLRRGLPSVPRGRLEAALDRLVSGDWSVESHPVVAAAVGDTEVGRALMDLTLVTAEPGRISEFAIACGEERLASVRADGVVVATPAGSDGYARAAGGPVLRRGAGVASVVPVAPFAIDAEEWVLPLEEVALTVERDETEVLLLADDRVVGPVAPFEPVAVSRVDGLDVVVLPESERPRTGRR